MWKEYAVDPAGLAVSYDRFCRFFGGFGWEHGRLLSRYPKKWFYDASSTSSAKQMDKKRMEFLLQHEKHLRLVSAGRPYNEAVPWLENAEHALPPFDTILAENNPHMHGTVVPFDDCDFKHAKWESPSTVNHPRNARSFADALLPLLARSNEILFIDPHFNPNASRFTDVLDAIITEIPFSKPELKRVEFHSDDTLFRGDPAKFKRDTQRNVSGLLPAGKSISFFIWRRRPHDEPGERFHNRYVITELGGLLFPDGLDQAEIDGQSTDLVRLSEVSRAKQWADFQPASPAHRLIGRFDVQAAT